MRSCGKIWCTIAWGVLFLGGFTASAQFDYTVTNGTASITGYHGSGGAVTIPASIGGVPVTRIGNAAFQNQTNIVTVSIPNGVTGIGAQAFAGCSWLLGVTLPANLPAIADETFWQCYQMTDIQIPNSVTNIGASAFYSCASLHNLVIPDSVRVISDNAFQRCWRLQTITMGSGTTNIGDYAFSSCSNLVTIRFGQRVATIGNRAFAGCNALMSVVLPRSLVNLGTYAFASCPRLREVYFTGNAPAMDQPFAGSYLVRAYYLPGAAGFSEADVNAPIVLWDARVTAIRASTQGAAKQFALELAGSSNLAVVVEASTNLINPVWVPIGTNTLLGLDPGRIREIPALLDQRVEREPIPFWDGHAGTRAADVIQTFLAGDG